jgi:hypothetical protein
MRTLDIWSNGLIHQTILCFNSQQLVGVREFLLDLNEDGTFRVLINYEGADGEFRVKNPFTDHLVSLRTTSLADDDVPRSVLTIESNGTIESTAISFNQQELSGVVSLLIYMRRVREGVIHWLRHGDRDEFVSEITFREADGRLTQEVLF